MGKDKHKDGETATSKTNPQDGCQDSQRDHRQDQEARDAALAQTIAKAVTREVAKAHAHYQAILNEKGAATLQTSLKVSSGSCGFKVMDPFNWTKDKSIYQRWQLWSYIDENGVRQSNPPVVNMLKIVNHIGATSGPQEKHLKFPIDVYPRGPYKHHLLVRVDTGADVNCMNEKIFKKLFTKVNLSVCPHKIQNFGNSVTDISILGQFCTYLQFRGEKYLKTFIGTNAYDCPNLLSHGATFRMGVLLPNYLEDNVVKAYGENVPNFKCNTSNSTSAGTSSNVFQILQDL